MQCHIYSIASDQPFLEQVAEEVLSGFPIGKKPDSYELARWMILLPTRRAVRDLKRIFLDKIGSHATLLPRLQPIGDIDEDFAQGFGDFALGHAITPIGREFALIALIDRWAADNPHLTLAQELVASPYQAQALAISLTQMIDSFEIEDADLLRFPDLYDTDPAGHREAILSFIDLARRELPVMLENEGLLSPITRRNRLLRLHARSLQTHGQTCPIIVAGSTGTIPATRELLRAVAQLDKGAVILPGVDLDMDEESWTAINAQHPQYALKRLLNFLEIDRHDVKLLGKRGDARSWLAQELMRPTETTEQWYQVGKTAQNRISTGLEGVNLIGCAHRQEEAAVIALIMRRSLEKPGERAALVTNDPDLVQRVKIELMRWNIEVEDSSGEILGKSRSGILLGLLLDGIESGFSAASLSALFHCHDTVLYKQWGQAARHCEIILFRAGTMPINLGNMRRHLQIIYEQMQAGKRLSGFIMRMSNQDWQEAFSFCDYIGELFQPLLGQSIMAPLEHLIGLKSVIQKLFNSDLWEVELAPLFEEFENEAFRLPPCHFFRFTALLRYYLRVRLLHNTSQPKARLSILGLLEARLLSFDCLILGGLNEGLWPSQPEQGPWLNRPMRALFGLADPEQQIGQMAHDFVQAFGNKSVYLTWSRRVGAGPAAPSRWLLRLQLLIKAVAQLRCQAPALQESWQDWLKMRDKITNVSPLTIPKPKPPREARPISLSATQIEKLLRDPYALYVEKILKLEILGEISSRPGAALRGTLIHEILAEFSTLYPAELPENAVGTLIEIATNHFAPFIEDPSISSFLWPRFCRMAHWLIAQEKTLSIDLKHRFVEVSGVLPLGNFFISARADRIDLLTDGSARLIDYKTGLVPSETQVKVGFAPQLVLEAAILAHGGFKNLPNCEARHLLYIKLTGAAEAGEIIERLASEAIMSVIEKQLMQLERLLLVYQQPDTAYVPRYALQNEDEISPYDHLSRFREWRLSETVQ